METYNSQNIRNIANQYVELVNKGYYSFDSEVGKRQVPKQIIELVKVLYDEKYRNK